MANNITVKKGDRIKITAKRNGHGFKIGDIVTVQRVGEVDIYAVGTDGGRGWYLQDTEYKPFNDHIYSKGDKAIVNGRNICGHEFAKGTVVTVKQLEPDGRVRYVEDVNGRGYYVENEEIEPYNAPTKERFKLGDVVYLKNIDEFAQISTEGALRSAENTSDTGIRLATEDERRKHLGLTPVKKDTDRIEISITVSRKALCETIEIMGNATRGYEVYSKLADIHRKENK